MTNQEFSEAYFQQARSIHRGLTVHYESQEWHLVVRRAQEIVELTLKGLLRRAGIEVPHIHDVGNLLRREAERLPKNIQDAMDRIISVSRHLRQERETSFYGDEEQELPPSALYTEIDARQAKTDSEWLLSLIPV
jgi:HEPN domain-containing protein